MAARGPGLGPGLGPGPGPGLGLKLRTVESMDRVYNQQHISDEDKISAQKLALQGAKHAIMVINNRKKNSNKFTEKQLNKLDAILLSLNNNERELIELYNSGKDKAVALIPHLETLIRSAQGGRRKHRTRRNKKQRKQRKHRTRKH